jgi:tetratricopeptide (TPR) repeat protein
MRCRSVAVPRAKASKAKAAKPKRAPEPVVDLPLGHSEQALVDRYYAMAEELNGRGSMELAVPFYRQTIALLLAEREQLRALSGDASAAFQASPDVDGVMAAALQVEGGSVGLVEAELLRQLGALDEELTMESCQEVAAALAVLQEQWGQPHGQLLGLQAKLNVLLGEVAAARDLFEEALALESGCERLMVNTGAARLLCGDASGAAALLRAIAQSPEQVQRLQARGSASSLWSNLAQAECELGENAAALEALAQRFSLGPIGDDWARWLDVAEQWLRLGDRPHARLLIDLLIREATPDQRRAVLPLLAELLELEGEFREAALIYRELLRPSLAA